MTRYIETGFDVTRLRYASPLLPPLPDGLTLAHISDLHNRRFQGGPQPLIDLLRAEKPDIIAVTGDLIDRFRPDIETAVAFIRLAAAVAPVYFVPGNHEFRSGQYEALLPRLAASGVHVLDDGAETAAVRGVRFTVAGLRDPAFFTDRSGRADNKTLAEREAALRRLLPGSGFTLLLSHRPELFGMYARCGVPLALTGHAHGGQVRLFGRGLYAPGQGVFPRYTSGLHRRGDTAMIVSRGLGGRLCRLRLFNRPEVVVIFMRNEECGTDSESNAKQ
jgi:predicted MPP superfamily phosphohydrolase